MNVNLTDEQRLLSATVDSLLEKDYDATTRLKLLGSDLGWSRDVWSRLGDLGLLGLMLDERHGGAEAGVDELAVVMASFGRALVLERYLPTVVLGGNLVRLAGTPEQQDELLPALSSGDLLLAFACTEQGSRWSFTDITTNAVLDRGRWLITGQKTAVDGGDHADKLIVTALTDGGDLRLFLVDARHVRRAPHRAQDGRSGADVLFESAPADELGAAGNALEAIEAVVDIAIVALCAETVGAMERMLDLTVDHLKTRVQFGRAIGSFQALQHRAADMYVSLEQARSMSLLARQAFTNAGTQQRRTLLHAAKLQIDLAARHVGQEAVQLHGGIGMTMEHIVGHYLRRTAVTARTIADVDELTRLVGAAGGLEPPR